MLSNLYVEQYLRKAQGRGRVLLPRQPWEHSGGTPPEYWRSAAVAAAAVCSRWFHTQRCRDCRGKAFVNEIHCA